jgi:hypothetical protein
MRLAQSLRMSPADHLSPTNERAIAMANIKKISVANVYGKIDLKELVNATAPIEVMRVYGLAVGSKSGTSQYGDWTALVGQFEAVNPVSGEVTQSAQCFLPEIALLPILTELAREGAKGVQFGIRLFVKVSNNTKPGGSPYEYTFEHMLPPSDNDPMAALRNAVSAALALPAPEGKGDEPPAPAPAPAAAAGKKK